MLFIANRLSHLGWTHFFQQQLPLDTSLRPMRVMGIQDNTWWLQDDLEVIQLAISDPDVVQGDWLLIDDTQTKVKRLDRQNHLDLGQCQLANIHALLLPDIQLKQALQGTISEDVLVFALGADANHEQLVFFTSRSCHWSNIWPIGWGKAKPWAFTWRRGWSILLAGAVITSPSISNGSATGGCLFKVRHSPGRFFHPQL